ncbi:hypothetical protein BDV40DRAFT_298662 [Aspergillus tamarii]|uniref:Secreted protein n=1 Tax=Aspergillus tamarii TaxID=41984 RepID=A0A5N6UZU4_ASPTM|nr:hypothetical protein BDV40DRAFT_298662 [Aspergillus tamarii]
MKLHSSLGFILLASAPLTNAWFVDFYSSHKCRGWNPGQVGDEGKPLGCRKLEHDYWSAHFDPKGDPYGIIFWKGNNCDGEYLTPGTGASPSCVDLDGMHSYAVRKHN